MSSTSIFEITQEARIEQWPGMASLVPNLTAHASLQSIALVRFDRMIAATAFHLGCPVVSRDAAFDGIVSRLW